MKKQIEQPLVSIVVLNWNGLEDTKLCLDSLRKLSYKNYEIIVVDNGSSKKEKSFFAKQKDIIFVDNPTNRGFTGGHIDGLQKCSGEYIVLMNNDAVMKPDYIDIALPMFTDDKVAAVGGRAYFWNDDSPLYDESNQFYSYMDIDVYTGEALMQSSDYSEIQEVNCVSGSAVMVRRAVIDEVGYLYDRFFAYFEETDLFARLKRAGYKVLYNPALQIWHKNGASSGASSGSRFFYYQIFRNRFIFAVRNFEPWFLRRFLYNYFKITVTSFIGLFLNPPNRTMHKAYISAAFYNLLHLPRTLGSRGKLMRKLGRSSYNHRLFLEQTGMSIVMDVSKMNPQALKQVVEKIKANPTAMHEYVFVTGSNAPKFETPHNVRLVANKNYFEVSPINLGCLAARFSWMLLVEDFHQIDMKNAADALASTLSTNKTLVAFGQPKLKRANYILIHKDFYQRVGGLGSELNLQTTFTNLVAYADMANLLLWHKMTTKDSETIPVHKLRKQQAIQLSKVIKYDQKLLVATHISRFGRLQNKYYRLYQVVTFIKWLFMWHLPLRLRVARLKNLALYTLTLRPKMLAQEFRHIRNEVLIHGGHHEIMESQKNTISSELDRLSNNPNDIPVFIICRDRVEPLEQLVGWLESHNLKKIVFIDNDSSYPGLMKYYEKTPYQVLRLMRNTGHTAPWTLGIIRSLVPNGFYIVSDPDVIPTEKCPADAVSHFLRVHKQFPLYEKVGFGLKIDDLPNHYPLKQHVIEWENQFWEQNISDGEPLYEAGLDTTFALYKPFTYTYKLHPSIRTGEPYTARHLPWYGDPKKASEEEQYYRFRVDQKVNSWNTDTLAERYAKEMGK